MINGAILIGAEEEQVGERFAALDAATGDPLAPSFAAAGPEHVARACAAAEAAFPVFSELAPGERAAFLDAIALEIEALGDALIERAMTETGLPRARLEGERGRTTGQLRMFAAHLRKGEWIDVTIDSALPERVPVPRPDLRRRHVALGPVAVFGASNFPLAFSVAGGDTASALAAGCPVVVKGHPAHPGTGELVARAVQAAARGCELPAGIFSYLPGPSNELGSALVADPRIRAVGFTGSRGGGLALMRIAAGRPEPIPVHAEMSSINPVLLLPNALRARGDRIAAEFVQSLTLGAGQFCTNPGLVVALRGPDLDRFVAAAAFSLEASPPAQMLTTAIQASFERGVDALARHAGTRLAARGRAGSERLARPALFVTDATTFLADPALAHEVFGMSAIVVDCADVAEMQRVITGLEGQLTATIQLDADDHPVAAELLPLLQRKAGRILANGWPTGVEVCDAMVHGGPFPATSDGCSTSVGTLAIARFLRPVCYQGLPASLLPPALALSNPWKLPRHVDGGFQPA